MNRTLIFVVMATSALGAASYSNIGFSQRHPERMEAYRAAVSENARSASNVVAYNAVSGSGGSQRLLSLCEVAAMLQGPAGVFHVNSLTGMTESDGTPATYVDLTLLEDWAGDAPKHIVARILGGPTQDPNIWLLWTVNLKKDEDVGLVLNSTSKENKDYPGIHNLGVFRDDTGKGPTNGQLFTTYRTSLSEIGKMVGTLRGALKSGVDPKNCAGDVAPDYDQLRPIQPEDAPGDIVGPVEKASVKQQRRPSTQPQQAEPLVAPDKRPSE